MHEAYKLWFKYWVYKVRAIEEGVDPSIPLLQIQLGTIIHNYKGIWKRHGAFDVDHARASI